MNCLILDLKKRKKLRKERSQQTKNQEAVNEEKAEEKKMNGRSGGRGELKKKGTWTRGGNIHGGKENE